MQPKVAFITDAPQIAGSEVWLRETLPGLRCLGLDAFAVLPRRPTLAPLIRQIEDARVPVRTYTELRAVPALSQDADLRVLQAWSPTTYRYLLSRVQRPVWVFVHDQLQYRYPFGLEALYREIYRHTKARLLRHANLILVGTLWAAAYLREAFGLSARAVPVGVDLERFRPATPEERRGLRERYRLERFTLITPARFAPEKNHLAVLQTARLVPEATFLLVGSGPLETPLRTLARAWGLRNVRFLGHRQEMPLLYRASDALLFPTLADNPGLVLLEAMASGIPVITSPFPPQAEVVSPSEGYLVPPLPHRLAEVVRSLMAHPERARELGARGRARMEAERSIAQATAQLAKTILEMM